MRRTVPASARVMQTALRRIPHGSTAAITSARLSLSFSVLLPTPMPTPTPQAIPSPTRPLIAAMVQRIAERFAPRAIVLFGSHARGTATAESDVDLLVVMPVTGSRRQVANAIDRALDDRRLPVDIVVMTPEQVARDRHVVGTLARPALAEGRLLYGQLPA